MTLALISDLVTLTHFTTRPRFSLQLFGSLRFRERRLSQTDDKLEEEPFRDSPVLLLL